MKKKVIQTGNLVTLDKWVTLDEWKDLVLENPQKLHMELDTLAKKQYNEIKLPDDVVQALFQISSLVSPPLQYTVGQGPGGHFMDDNYLKMLLERIEQDAREREERYHQDAIEREQRFHQAILEQERRLREDAKEREERYIKLFDEKFKAQNELFQKQFEHINSHLQDIKNEMTNVTNRVDNIHARVDNVKWWIIGSLITLGIGVAGIVYANWQVISSMLSLAQK